MKVVNLVEREMTYEEKKNAFFNLSLELSIDLGHNELHDEFLKFYSKLLDIEEEKMKTDKDFVQKCKTVKDDFGKYIL